MNILKLQDLKIRLTITKAKANRIQFHVAKLVYFSSVFAFKFQLRFVSPIFTATFLV